MLAERIEDKDYDEMGDADTDEKDVDVSEEALGEGELDKAEFVSPWEGCGNTPQ